MDVASYIEVWMERHISEEDTLAELEGLSEALLQDLENAGFLSGDDSEKVVALSRVLIAGRLRAQSTDADYASYFRGEMKAEDDIEGEDTYDLAKD